MTATDYLDTFLNPHRIAIHRAILARLIPVWLLLSLILGGSAYWIESQRVNNTVLDLSMKAMQRFEQISPPALATPPAALNTQLDQLLRQTQFAGIRLYDVDHRLLTESWRLHANSKRIPLYAFSSERHPADNWHLPSSTMLPTPDSKHPEPARQTPLQIDHQYYVQSLHPLRDATGRLTGYMEVIYPLPAETAKVIGARIGDTLFMVLLVVALSSLALYPIIVALNRDSIRLSHNLLASNVELMRVLGSAIAKRDSDTDSHNFRVTLYAVELAQAMDRPSKEVIALMAGAFLHDVGKIGISDSILLKPGPLNPQEFEVMKTHVKIGLEIISEVKWLSLAEEVVACHHEKYDGSGYPFGLKGQQIPFNARLFAIIDVFDALTSKRPYKAAFPYETAIEMMLQDSGRHFDPLLLSHFITLAPVLYARYYQAETRSLRHKLSEIAVGKYFHQSNSAP